MRLPSLISIRHFFTQRDKHSTRLILLGLILFALLIRLLMLKDEANLQDGAYYAVLGKELISGNFVNGLSTYWPPLYPLLIGIFSLVFHDLELAGQLVSVVTGSLLVLPVYFIALSLYGRRPALWASILVAVDPLLVMYSTQLEVEPTYVLCFMTGVYLCMSALEGKPGRYFLAGLAFGACYLLRPEAIGYIGLLVGLIYAARIYNKLALSRLTRNALALLVGFMLLATPYLLYIHHTTNQWMISAKLAHLQKSDGIDNSWRKLDASKEGTLSDKLWSGGGALSIEAQSVSKVEWSFSAFLKKTISNLRRTVKIAFGLMPIVLYLFLIFGLVRQRGSKERTLKEIFIALFILSTLLGYSFMFTQRYLLPILPLMLCLVAKGIVEFKDWFIQKADNLRRPEFKSFKLHWLPTIGIALILLLAGLPLIKERIQNNKRDLLLSQKKVGSWMREESSGPPLVMATKIWSTFYAGGKHLYLPSEEYKVVIEYARRKKVDFLVVEENYIDKTPELKPLLNEASTPELKLVFVQNQIPGNKVLIYKLVT